MARQGLKQDGDWRRNTNIKARAGTSEISKDLRFLVRSASLG